MKLSQRIGPRAATRSMVAVVLAAALAGVAGAPLAAHAEPIINAGDVLTTWQTSDVASIEATSGDSVLDLAFGSILATSAIAAPAAAPVRVAKKRRTVRQIIADTGRAAGCSRAEVQALLWMAWRESRFHPTSHSRSNCHGLFQLSAGMAHGKPWKNPVWNTKRAIKYMRGRYGGVLQAKRFWQTHHWY